MRMSSPQRRWTRWKWPRWFTPKCDSRPSAVLANGAHVTAASGDDPLGARAAMLALLRGDRAARRALCALLERDYACFGYDHAACLDGSALPDPGGRRRARHGRRP